MTKIFISYRRNDSEGSAWRLYDHLLREFDKSDIFIDGAGIAPGDKFANVLNEHLNQAKIMLAVIDKAWLTAVDKHGKRRLEDPDDYVRREIVTALTRDTVVMPVLIGTTPMPSEDELPEELSQLAANQAIWLSHARFADDVKRLAEAIIRYVERSAKYDHRDFAKEIIDDFNRAFVISEFDDEHKLQLYYGSETAKDSYFSSHLRLEAISHLIQGSDIEGWEKSEKEVQPYEFWDKMLRVITSTYRRQLPYETDNRSDFDILRQLLEDIERPFPNDEDE
ncbi:MAG: toll/interleukin-1 receptor domain-containing protein [Anaerolineae bacterium]|nr:toll/interleukin-1 receptor domain-containing protein [Anaerolineae bacterium]